MTEVKQGGGFPALSANPITRRELLRAAGIGAGALVAGGVLSACTSDAPGVQETAATGGTLRASLLAPIQELDPTVASSESTIAVNDFVYENLYRAERFPPYTISPELAAAMPREITPTKYRIGLREGVTFHDGGPLTADDVVFTLQRIQDPEVVNPLIKPFFDLVTAVRAVNPHEIELELSEPTTLLTQRLKLLPVLSKSAVAASDDALSVAPVGSGPYRVVSVVAGERAKLEKFSDYSGERELNYDVLELGVVTDSNARVAGLLAGEVDVILGVPASAFMRLADTPGLKAEAVAGPWSTDIFFNCSKPPFDDVRVRRAVLYAIDRDSITESTFFGLAEPGWAGFIRPNNPDYAEPDTTYRYDPDFAKELLAEAGYAGKPIPIDFRLATDIEFLWSQGPIIEQNLLDVGFAPNIIPGAFSAVVAKLTEGDYHLSIGSGSRALDPTAEFDLRMHYGGGFPESVLHWDGEALDNLRQVLDAAQSTPDEATFRQRLAEAQNILQEEVPHSRPHWKDTLTAWSDKLEGFRALPISLLFLDGVRGGGRTG